ncbi:MAG: hypothetical protein ACTHM6_19260, partial [Tepidisphaeraceae bacterium]
MKEHFRTIPAGLAVVAAISLAGCTVGPDYQAPQVHVGPNFSELSKTTSADPATQPSALNARGEPIV